MASLLVEIKEYVDEKRIVADKLDEYEIDGFKASIRYLADEFMDKENFEGLYPLETLINMQKKMSTQNTWE